MGMVFSRQTDNILSTATGFTVVTGTVETGYGTSKLYNGNQADPFRLTDFALELVIQFPVPVTLEIVSILHHAISTAARLQANTSNVWTSTPVDRNFGVPVLGEDGLFTSPSLDLRGTSAYDWWKLTVATNAYAIVIGELWFGTDYRRTDALYTMGAYDPADEGSTIVHVTEEGAELAYQQMARREVIDGSVMAHSGDFAVLQGMVQSSRYQARPFLMIPDESVDDAWLVKYAGDRLSKPTVENVIRRVPFPVRQMSRGEAWISA